MKQTLTAKIELELTAEEEKQLLLQLLYDHFDIPRHEPCTIRGKSLCCDNWFDEAYRKARKIDTHVLEVIKKVRGY